MASKAVIYLDGVSSAIIQEHENIKRNILQGCRMLGLETVEYENTMEGFAKLRDDFNQPDTLYIVADSLPYHLCDNAPVILISRSIQWAQSSPKANCIGRLTMEMIERGYDELVGMIARNKPMRQFHDHLAARTIFVYNEYPTRDSGAMYRESMAAASWAKLHDIDYHFEINAYEDDKLPFVSEILQAGMSRCSHPDDIVVFTNRDICLVPESVGILRAFMDSRDIEACYAHRVDIRYEKHLDFKELRDENPDWGIDFFAFRAGSQIAAHLCEVPLFIGRSGWDLYWASKVQIRLPYNICYHYPHESDWKSGNPVVEQQNAHNYDVIWALMPEIMRYDKTSFVGLGPTS